jgi:transcription antitermination factor NusB
MNPLNAESTPVYKAKALSSRSVARAVAIQGVFLLQTPQADFLNYFLEPILSEGQSRLFEDGDFYSVKVPWLLEIVQGVKEYRESLFALIQGALSKSRSVSDLEDVTRSILLCGAWELQYALEVPVPVVMNEYIEWAKSFLPQDSHTFVHGVLDHIRLLVRSSQPLCVQESR